VRRSGSGADGHDRETSSPAIALRRAVGVCRPAGYTPRATASSDLVRIAAEHLPSFLERIEQTGGSLPAFVTHELRGLLRCGDLAHGFLRFACRHCGDEPRVPFSCEARSVCPSCIGRRMAETAAAWVDQLLPAVPYRQWVLSFRSPLSVRLGYDARGLGVVCRSLTRHVGRLVRDTVARGYGLVRRGDLHTGLRRRPRLRLRRLATLPAFLGTPARAGLRWAVDPWPRLAALWLSAHSRAPAGGVRILRAIGHAAARQARGGTGRGELNLALGGGSAT
jgi:hypothetical protein